MARFVKYNWIAGINTDCICKMQSCTAGEPLIINGFLRDAQGNGNIIGSGSVRDVAISSNNDASGVKFNVKGIQNGCPISEKINGPQAGTTSHTTKIFDIVTSITPDITFHNNVEVGVGWIAGHFPIIQFNHDISPIYGGPFWGLSVVSQLNMSGDTRPGGIIIVGQTLDDIYNNGLIKNQMLFIIPTQATSGSIILQNPSVAVPNTAAGSDGDTVNQIFFTNQLVVVFEPTSPTSTAQLIFRQT